MIHHGLDLLEEKHLISIILYIYRNEGVTKGLFLDFFRPFSSIMDIES